MRVVDTSVPAKGFIAHNGQTFKILATYDGGAVQADPGLKATGFKG